MYQENSKSVTIKYRLPKSMLNKIKLIQMQNSFNNLSEIMRFSLGLLINHYNGVNHENK